MLASLRFKFKSLVTTASGAPKSKTTILALHGLALMDHVQRDVFERVPERTTAAVADRQGAIHIDDRNLVDQLLCVRAMHILDVLRSKGEEGGERKVGKGSQLYIQEVCVCVCSE